MLATFPEPAAAQTPPGAPAATAAPLLGWQPKKPAGKKGHTDLEVDPDAKPADPPPLPPADPNAWGVGGKEEDNLTAHPKPKAEAPKAAGDEDEKKPVNLGLPGSVYVDTVIGFGKMFDVTNQPVLTDVTVISAIVGLQYRFGDVWTLGVRMPFSNASVGLDAGASGVAPPALSTSAAGNLEIQMKLGFQLTHHLRLPVGVSFLLPTAAGDLLDQTSSTPTPSSLQGQVNQAAAYSRGWEENALFTSKHLGFVPTAGLTYDLGAAHVAFGTKFEIMTGAGVEQPSPTSPKTAADLLHDPNTNWVTNLSFFYDFFDGKLTPGLRAWLAVATLPIAQTTVDYSGAEFVLEPDVTGRFPFGKDDGFALKAGLGLILPVAGQLNTGEASMTGVRIEAAFEF